MEANLKLKLIEIVKNPNRNNLYSLIIKAVNKHFFKTKKKLIRHLRTIAKK